ncbi:MAG: TRAM domain-containing protein, partial [Firmicutes bacterium]|nr:TRAM domain-containing protein [Bacillota bacterium]
RQEVVLVEGVSRKNPGVWSARTRDNKVVLLDRDPGVELADRFVPVRITGARTFYLTGEVAGAPLDDPLPPRDVALPLA